MPSITSCGCSLLTRNHSCVCNLYVSESFFENGLEREKANLKEFRCSDVRSTQTRTQVDMCVATTETSITAILAMFMERGGFSGHCYQPFVNHRELDVALFLHEHLNDKGVRQRPMVESHVLDEPDESFGLITPITFFPYEVRNDSDGLGIRSHGTLVGRRGSSREAVQANSFLNGRTAYHVTGAAFSRTLELFGYKWVGPDGAVRDGSTPPTVDELMQFLELFREHGLDTKDHFESFLRAFDLERFYQYNDRVAVWYNIRYLSEILRALTPFRLAVLDGQHRAVLMALFTCGYFYPSNEVLLDGSVALSESLGDRSADFQWDAAQVWRQTKISIGFAVDTDGDIISDLDSSQALLRRYGEVLTNAQSQSITFSWVQLYRDLIGILERSDNSLHFDQGSAAKRLGFEFWSRSADKPLDVGVNRKATKTKPRTVSNNWYIYEQRLTSLFDALVDYTDKNKIAAAFLFDHPQQKDVSKSWIAASQTMFVSGGKFLATDRRSTDALSMILNFLKILAFEPDLYQKLRLVTEIPDVQVMQHSDDVMQYISGFRSPWWLQTFVMGTVKANHEVFIAKLLTERKILETLRAMSPVSNEVKNLLAERDPDFSCLGCAIPINIADMKASKLGIQHTRGVTITSKIQFAFFQTIVLDILEAIGHYGYSPDLLQVGMKPSECKNYTWYLK